MRIIIIKKNDNLWLLYFFEPIKLSHQNQITFKRFIFHFLPLTDPVKKEDEGMPFRKK